MPPKKKITGPGSSDNFVFETAEGTVLTLPSLAKIKPGLIRKIRRMNDVDQLFTILETILTDDELTVVDEMEYDEFERLNDEWAEHSGVDVGKLRAS